MRIKTFEGRTLEALLPEIKSELGDNAVVIGQRTKVQGGIGGFFGTKIVEITAADQMPSDDDLVDLEQKFMGQDETPEPDVPAGSTFNMVDDWDPAADAELAHEYGRVLEHARQAVGDQGLATIASGAPAAHPASFQQLDISEATPPRDILGDARRLADQAHERVNEATERVDTGVYAPSVQPQQTEQPTTTFRAEVTDNNESTRPLPGIVASTQGPQQDLGILDAASVSAEPDAIAAALAQAVDSIDVRAMEAVRSAMQSVNAIPRTSEAISADHPERVRIAAQAISSQLNDAGVDDVNIERIVHTALSERLVLSPDLEVRDVIRDVLADSISVAAAQATSNTQRRVAIVGARGSGKSLLTAKLAKAYTASGLRVGIISIVPGMEGQVVVPDPSLQGLGIDLRYVANPVQTADAAEACATLDVVLYDTPGRAYVDDEILTVVSKCLDAAGVKQVTIAVPASTNVREMQSVSERFDWAHTKHMAITRLDECRHAGQIANFCFATDMPIALLASGDDDAGIVEAASRTRIVNLIMPTEE